MFLQAIETATSFWGASFQYILWWLSTAVLAYLVYRFWDGSKYRDQIEAKDSTIRRLKPELDVLTNKQEHLTTEKNQLKKNLEELLNKHNSLKAYHDTVQAKYQAASKQFEQGNEERQSLLDSYESLERNLEASEQKYNEALTKIDKLENELENIEDSGSQNGPLLKEIQRLEDLLIEKNKEVNNLQVSLASASVPATGLNLVDSTEIASLEKEYALSVEEREKIQISYTALQKDYNQLRNSYTTLTNNFQSLEQANSNLTNQVQSLQLNITSLKKNKGTATDSLALKQSNASLTNLQQKLKDLQTHNLQQGNSLKQLELNYRDLETQKESINKTKEQLRNQYTRIDKELKELKAVNANLKGRYDELSEQYQLAQTSSKELQSTILDLEKEHSEKKGSLSQIEQMAIALKKENETLKKQTVEIELSKKQVTQQYLTAKKEANELQEQLKSKGPIRSENRTEVQQLKLKLQAQSTELLKTQEQLKGLLETRSANLALNTNNKSLNTAYSNLQKKYDSFYKDYLNIKTQFQFLRDKYEHLENTSASVSEQRQKLNATNTQLALEVNKLREAQQSLLAEKIDYEKRLKEMEKYLAAPAAPKNVSRTTRVVRKNGVPPKKADDLTIVEGIGPKIEQLLNNNGVATWKKLSHTGIGELKRLLTKNGYNAKMHDPSTWPEQAELANNNKWTELEKLKNELINGVRR